MRESEKWKWSHSVVSDSSDPMDCSLPGSSVHGIFQAKVLEWGAIAFSDMLILISTNSNLKMQRRLCCRVTHLPPISKYRFFFMKKKMHVNREQVEHCYWRLAVKGCRREPPETSTVVKRAAAVAPSLALDEWRIALSISPSGAVIGAAASFISGHNPFFRS